MTRQDSQRTARSDERAVTVTDSVAAGSLIVMALLLSAGLGLGVLYAPSADEGNETRAEFSFEHFPDDSALVVTFTKGDSIPAGELALVSDQTNVTWATLANTSESEAVSQGSTVQLTGTGTYGKPITTSTQVRVVYTGGNESRALATWPRESASG